MLFWSQRTWMSAESAYDGSFAYAAFEAVKSTVPVHGHSERFPSIFGGGGCGHAAMAKMAPPSFGWLQASGP